MTVRLAGRAPGLDASEVRFVLVEPRHAGNVGSAARALKNLGFWRLELVRPACDPRDDEARRMAVDAHDLLVAVRLHDDLDSALHDARSVIGMTARTGKQRRPHWRLDALSGELARMAATGALAVVFGREDRGLTDAELDRCTHLVHLPTASRYPSVNLAQAVLLVAYELRLATLRPMSPDDDVVPADHAAREALFRHLQEALLGIGFVTPETSESILRRMRRLLGRARLTEEDTRMLRGLARQILWAAARAGLTPRRGAR